MPKLLPTKSAVSVNRDSILTIFAAHTFSDADTDEGGLNHTPSSNKEEVNDDLLRTSHLFLRNLFAKKSDINAKHSEAVDPALSVPPRYGDWKSLVEYAVENVHSEIIMIAKQIRMKNDGGRIPIIYNLEDRIGRTLITTDGHQTMCGMHSLLNGEHEVVRGKVALTGFFRKVVAKDFQTGMHYEVTFPCWFTFATFFMFCCPTILKCRKLNSEMDINGQKVPGQTVAYISRQKWEGTIYENQVEFGVHFLRPNEDADTKLFVFATALILFHLYFKTPGREYRNLITLIVYIAIALIIVTLLCLKFIHF